MIDYVNRAEDFLAAAASKARPVAASAVAAPEQGMVLPILRGAVSPEGKAMVLHLRQGPEVLAALARPDAESLLTTGVLTPDHVIRTKNYPLFLDLADKADESALAAGIAEKVGAYAAAYDACFAAQVAAKGVTRVKLDPLPRVVLVPGLGIIGVGGSAKAARIAADIAEHAVLAKVAGAAVGPYRELDAASIFDMEYWSLEQAKLGKGKPLPLAGRVALVTGGGGAIALGIGRKLLEAGARVYLADIDGQRLAAVCEKLAAQFGSATVSPLAMDVTDGASVAAALAAVVRECGGLDILVPNAGIAHVARLEALDTARFQQVMAVNCLGVFEMIKAAVPIFRRQGMGGQVIINSSKNVFDPGPAFGAYSASKAGAHQLGKIAALELAEIGVRVNMINADAIFDADGVSSGLWDVVGPDRMRARNLDPEGLKEYYRNRNLLKTEVLADHVGNAVVFFASGLTPTTGATLPVDGGIPAAFPR
jgi:NAD(P)-dependent dehydrogenase (short-subunit alcohol dehydrogenase family)